MSAYLIAQIATSHEDKLPAYRDAVGPCAEKFGGRYLARAATVEVLEGGHDGRRLVMFEFPSIDAIRAFWRSPEYAEVKALRAAVGDLDVWAVPGV